MKSAASASRSSSTRARRIARSSPAPTTASSGNAPKSATARPRNSTTSSAWRSMRRSKDSSAGKVSTFNRGMEPQMHADQRGSENVKRQILFYLRSSAFICGFILFICGCRSTGKPDKPVTIEPPPPQPVSVSMSVADAMKLIDAREDWTKRPPINVPRHPAEKFLKDLTIVIDPGHGGEDGGDTSTQPGGYKTWRGGEKEAHIKPCVALLLERLLKEAGCDVVMTRHGDDTIGLRARADVANNVKRRRDGGVGADLFVSIHHNAGAKGSNYTSVWYHGSVDDNEPDLDVARYLALELGRAQRTQVAKTSPIFSSQLM